MARIDFLGKGDIAGHHLSVPFYTLKADRRKSIDAPDLDGNLIIHGDNLLALKALLPLKRVFVEHENRKEENSEKKESKTSSR
ncbi:MAG: hypothetical protein OXF24_05965 [Hyphomicrobiales bacterium]|nr:hypothetical protein [Hyphomicrobiales bacterium]MCY4053226.1 hypothetical protein [Hyphomicrobiales bacterium]